MIDDVTPYSPAPDDLRDVTPSSDSASRSTAEVDLLRNVVAMLADAFGGRVAIASAITPLGHQFWLADHSELGVIATGRDVRELALRACREGLCAANAFTMGIAYVP